MYVKCSLEKCKNRDSKGLYKKGRQGENSNFTGSSAPYEDPVKLEIIIEMNYDSYR
jgi:adenylylsulfate kinase